jgi:hypothetical protein
MTRRVSIGWREISGLAHRRRVAATAALLVTGLGAAIAVQAFTSGNASAQTWQPSAAQVDQAIVAAYLEASSTVPGPGGVPASPYTMPVSKAESLVHLSSRASSWPSNVAAVEYIGSYRQAASQFVDGSTVPDNRPVLVLRMTGQFSVASSAPQGAVAYATGTVLTAVLDAKTGEVLDFGLTDSAKPLPSPHVLFVR